MEGIVFAIQRFSLFDGPGVRTVVFLKGCPLRCVWCHNPEGLSGKPQFMVTPEVCISCGECARSCPRGARRMTAHGLQAYDVQGCEMCGLCASACCTGALTVAGKMMDTDAVMSEVLRDASLYAESGGGMTLSGGEPLFQGDFTLSLLQAAKTKGIHTCLETCGYASPRLMQAVAVHTDLFYYDYKATGEAMHQKLTGVSQERILENLALLDRLEAEVVLRCPIIPGVNDTEAHIEGIGRTARRHTCIREVHLEPYHHLGVSKAVKLGVEVMCESTPPAPDVMEDYRCRVTEAAQKPCKIS